MGKGLGDRSQTLGVRRTVRTINRKEGGVKGLPPGDQRLGEKARVQNGHEALFPWLGCGLELSVSAILHMEHCLPRTAALALGWAGREMLCSVESQTLGPGRWNQPRPQFAQISPWGWAAMTLSSPQPACKLSFTTSNDRFIYRLSLALSLQKGAKMLINTRG